MNNKENVPKINTATDKSTGNTTAPETIELLQKLGDKVMHDTEELAVRIRKEAQSEAARLIEDMNVRVREIINQAQRQVKTVAGKEALRAATTVTGGDTSKAYVRPEPASQANEAVSGPEFGLKDIIGSKAASGVGPSSQKRTGKTLVAVEVEADATSEPKLPQADAELFLGEVTINVASPVNIKRLLGLIRSLENTKGIRILGTLGSRNSGTVINVSLDKPLPLLTLLRGMPFVAGVKAEDKSSPSSAPEQSDVRRISVVTRDGGCGPGKEV